MVKEYTREQLQDEQIAIHCETENQLKTILKKFDIKDEDLQSCWDRYNEKSSLGYCKETDAWGLEDVKIDKETGYTIVRASKILKLDVIEVGDTLINPDGLHAIVVEVNRDIVHAWSVKDKCMASFGSNDTTFTNNIDIVKANYDFTDCEFYDG